ncbi:hypothetical protein LI90_3995 [Carbonactinospora thermoautotrophica]|uniref:VapC45 PIN like domain-containing protein n=1 Tax=Carbonactinospora thermoautotrophica TaxID=1469144 RepID=A0A132MYZ5_9ACTN|nr:hypothetical protein [Carbonactinospora thermoautotrophica]KWX02946.1 hypothetical protein LI90_3995 [Carbonactinospora thermoautotrophica]
MIRSDLRLFLDRSVGTRKVAAGLRELGIEVQTIQERYGSEAPRVADVRWIADATADGWVLLGADQRIRYRPLERRALCLYKARYFAFPRGDLTARQMVDRVAAHLDHIARIAVHEPGPYVYHLTESRVVAMKLDCDEPDEPHA